MIARALPLLGLAAIVLAAGCRTSPDPEDRPAGRIIVAGVSFPVEAPVVTFRDPGGYDAYAERCRFRPDLLPTKPAPGCDTVRRYGTRGVTGLDPVIAERVAHGGYDLVALRSRVDQFVVHYDACGTSRRCFEVLQDLRGLSVHFLLDVDGTIYQTLDVAERARHAGVANDRSVGVEIAQIGAYADRRTLDRWYQPDPDGRPCLVFPAAFAAGAPPPAFGVPRPARDTLQSGTINGSRLVQYDFTDAQYRSLTALVRALREALPRIRPRVPRSPDGSVLDRCLAPGELSSFQGLLGHCHVSAGKVDPGPAFDWARVLSGLGPATAP